MKKVRYGLIGFGAWGWHHARAISECAESELVVIAERAPATQVEARANHPAADDFAANAGLEPAAETLLQVGAVRSCRNTAAFASVRPCWSLLMNQATPA